MGGVAWSLPCGHLIGYSLTYLRGICSNPRYSWVTYFILSNICNFSQLVLSILSTHRLFALSIFITFSIFRRLIKRLSSSRPFLSIHFLRYHLTLEMHLLYTLHTHTTTLSCLIERTLSAPIFLSNSPDVLGHCAILIWGWSRHGWGVSPRTTRTKWYPLFPYTGSQMYGELFL